MAVTICIPLQDVEAVLARLRVRLPGIGTLQAMRESLENLPSPTKAVQQFMGLLDVALLPLRNIVQIMEMIVGLLNCIDAVRDSISELSITPMTDCITNLSAIINRLAEYIPPFPYLVALSDIVLVLIVYVDEVLRALLSIDARITELNAIRARASSLSDTNLQLIADCVQSEVNAARANALGGLEALARFVGLAITIVDFIPGVDVDTDGIDAGFDRAAIEASENTVRPIADALLVLRQTLVVLYRVLATPANVYIEPLPATIVALVN